MVTVGVRELKQRACELVRLVGESGLRVQITHRGKVVAILVPVRPKSDPNAERHAWNSLDSLAAEIGASWPEGVSAAQAVGAARR
jgi:antitoxin (DNA-binding transcriptional repressor) of toxin-antitoxin stability system